MSAGAMRLSDLESTRLSACEHVIERGLKSFTEVGEALLTIRDNRLYRATHGTFEEYCRQRWQMTPQHAGRLIGAYEVVEQIEPIGSIPPPTNEAQARELAPLRNDPQVMRDVWREVVEGTDGKPTAAAVREHVERVRDPLPQRRQERIDVVGVMAQVVTHADRAARAAQEIERGHLSNKAAEAAVWRDDLGRSLEVLNRLHILLEGISE